LILPEHYLNQTQLADGITPDTNHSSWATFSVQPFGTGLFYFKSFTEGKETILEVNPDSWWLNTTITNDSILNWTQRFGTFSGSLNQLRIKILASPFSPLDTKLALSYLNTGKIDLLQGMDIFDVQMFVKNKQIKTKESSEYDTSYLFFNLRESWPTVFNDKTPCDKDPTITKGLAIRKAIYYALNRTEMTSFYQSNGLIVHDSLFTQDTVWSDPNLIEHSVNLEKAKEYLELAGYIFETATLNQSFATILILTSSITFTAIIVITIKKRD
jgi:ABC-type transport system substrate-binding protein